MLSQTMWITQKNMKELSKIESIKYLIKNSVYGNEWQGAGMWEAVLEIMKRKYKITTKFLDKLLKEAEDF
jgi:hypothetical protein